MENISLHSLGFLEILFAALVILQSIYFALVILAFRRKEKSVNSEQKPVSIIVAFKNEEDNLKDLISRILEQKHSDFELLLLDDHSTDGSVAIISQFTDHRIKLIQMAEEKGKKAAVQKGIEAAAYDRVLLTDADCEPLSSEWISRMTGYLVSPIQICIGYSGFYAKPSLLNALQRFENAVNSIQNYTFNAFGRAYMAVGRNLAYDKSILQRIRPNAAQDELRSAICILFNCERRRF